MKNIGLYIHIPFCKKKCDYCDFISFSNKNEYIEKYVETICKDIKFSATKAKQCNVNTIYFGGGTPSFINENYINQILLEIMDNYNILEDCEITIEVNPGTATREKLAKYRKYGINRLSIGLQSSQNRLLELIGRIHNYNEFLQTYNLAREVRI